ncbi:hypothetical protein GCM10023195_06940 [Actinoallomurus liliacearum]|uniref:Uncharacterized protein n=1 Tax=Actinoallomurus liliacearum TaxID=1080073 RepID=A0ABP8TE42_9ACTN
MRGQTGDQTDQESRSAGQRAAASVTAIHRRRPARALTTPYHWFRVTPHRVQSWHEVNEPPDRELMRDGRRLV